MADGLARMVAAADMQQQALQVGMVVVTVLWVLLENMYRALPYYSTYPQYNRTTQNNNAKPTVQYECRR